MLPRLPKTDLLSHVPDIIGFDPWNDDFSQVPGKSGVYVIKNPKGEIVYIGATGRKSSIKSKSGLNARIRDHVREDSKINEYNKTDKLLVDIYITASSADALKYENEAILKHRPILNEIRAGIRSEKALKEKGRKYALRNQRSNLYDSNRIKKCSICNLDKPCSDFNRNNSAIFGVMPYDRVCEKVFRKQTKALNLLKKWEDEEQIESQELQNVQVHNVRN